MSRVTESAMRVGRSPESITLVAVTKGVDDPYIHQTEAKPEMRHLLHLACSTGSG